MNEDPTEYQPSVELTQAAYNPYTAPYYEGLPIIPPPPPPVKRQGKTLAALSISISVLIVLGCTLLILYHIGILANTQAQTNSTAPFATPSAIPLTTSTPTPFIDPNYTATEILNDFTQAGASTSYIMYGVTIWDYSQDNYFVNVHATSSATWLDPAQTYGSASVGLWIYNNVATAQSAFTQVGQDESQGSQPYAEWATEYVHGRCLLLVISGSENTWSGYDSVMDQYCV